MKKLVFLLLFFSLGLFVLKENSAAQSRSLPSFSLPEQARPISPGVFYLGQAVDQGKLVQGYALIDYKNKKKSARPGRECGNSICEPGENAKKCPQDCGSEEPDTSSCYGFLAKEAKWRTREDYVIDPFNNYGLTAESISSIFASAVDQWEDAADGLIGNRIAEDILGNQISGVVNGADTESPDDKNEVFFADIADSNAIAVTIIWGVFGGPPWQRELVEWDQIYDQVDFSWSNQGEVGKMDLANIATHELGHSLGLADLYQDQCQEQTMFGYAAEGEIKKRTLEAGDIKGISELYQ